MKKIFAILFAVVLCFVLGVVAFADETTWTGTVESKTLTGGTESDPLVITVNGEVSVTGTITVSGYVKIVGDGNDTLKKAFGTDNLFTVSANANLIVENLTIDGGAVWTGDINTTLNRGTVNNGFSGGNMVKNDSGYACLRNCTLKNHDGSQIFHCDATNYKDTLYVDGCKIVNSNGGVLWTRSYATFENTEMAYNSGTPSIFRLCTSSKATVKNCDVHHNYSAEGNTFYGYAGSSFELRNTKIRENVAKSGGAISISNQTAYLYDCEVTNNTATEKGGAFVIDSGHGMYLENSTVVSGNSAPMGSAAYCEQWLFMRENVSITNNSGSAAIYASGNANLNLNGTFSGNEQGDVYTTRSTAVSVGGSISDISVSTDNITALAVGKIDETDLTQIVGKIKYNGTITEDTAIVPFVKSDSSAIEFATVVLNADEDHPAAILPFTTLEVNTLPKPEKDHHIFVGWYTDAELQNALGDAALEAGKTYYAKYTKSGYTETPVAQRTFDFGEITYGETQFTAKNFTFGFSPSDGNPDEAASVTAVTATEAFNVTFSEATVTIQPKENLNAGIYDETIYVTVHDGSVHSLYAKLTVNKVGSATTATNISATYGDKITLSVNVARVESGIMMMDLDEPEQDTVVFYCGETLLGEATITYADDTNTSGTASLTYDTSKGGIPVQSGNTITVKYGGSINLLGSNGTITVDLAPKDLTVTGLIATNRVYDGTTSVEVTGGELEGIIGEDEVSVGTVTATADKNAGNGKAVTISNITLTGKDAGNYMVSAYPTDVTVNITPATLTVTADSHTVEQGAKMPDLTYKVEGLIRGDTFSNPTITTVENTDTLGTYKITISDGTYSNNYEVKYVNGTLTVTAKSNPKPETKPESCNHSFDANGKCKYCGIIVIDHTTEKADDESNPNTGAESAIGVAAAIAALSLAGIAVSKKK